jgi:diguanylate cyclase (GGDEF)-like protein/PAS domain S-box-containing protein
VDRPAHRLTLPDGLPVVGLFGGALGLVAVALVGEAPVRIGLAALAFAVVIASGAILVRRLRSATARVEEAGSRLQVLVEHVPAAVYIDLQDPDVTDGGRLGYMSPQVTAILGFRPNEFVDDPELWPSRIHPDDRDVALAAYADHWRTGEPLRAEYRMLGRDGTEVWVRDEAYAMADDARTGKRMSQGLLIDITDRKRLESKLIHDALHDPLTGLANRVLVRDHVERALARQGRGLGVVAVLFVDLDDFKHVNDSYGHPVGDEILVQVAARMVDAVRAEDVVGRQSGDEFAVVLERVANQGEAILAAERILRELRRPIVLGGRSIVVGGSIGIALAPEHDATVEDLVTRADGAMYAAKAEGKGTYAVYESRMPTRTWTELEAAG